MTAIARKFRPQTFKEIVGQPVVVQCLTNSILNNTIHHSYIFSGFFGIGKCIKYDTLIPNAITGELLTVEQIYRNQEANILTLKNDYKLCRSTPCDFIDDGVKPCYRITTKSGRTIEVTLSHPFLTILGWKKLSKISVGDYIATPRQLPIEGSLNIPEHEVKLLGYLISEGYLCRKGQISFSNNDNDISKDYIRCVKKLGNINVRKVTGNSDRSDSYVTTSIVRCDNTRDGFTNELKIFVNKYGLLDKKSAGKFVPAIIFKLKKNLIALFLKALFSSDGCIEYKRPALSYATASKTLIKQVQHLLLRFGINTIIRTKLHKTSQGMKSYWELNTCNHESILYFNKYIGFTGYKKKNLKQVILKIKNTKTNPNIDIIPSQVQEIIKKEKAKTGKQWSEVGNILGYKIKKHVLTPHQNLSRKTLTTFAMGFDSKELYNISTSDIYWDKIKEIKYIGQHQVYDLTIPETHNFVANDIIVHNTSLCRVFAKRLNCYNPINSEPCNQCVSCLEITNSSSQDVLEIDAASNTGVDNVRDTIIANLDLTPARDKYRIFIIDECHLLSNSAFSALLKSVEEPPSYVIFMMATTERQKIPSTIISRSQIFELKAISANNIFDTLKDVSKILQISITDDALRLLARSGQGSLREAESNLDKVVSYSKNIDSNQVTEVLNIVSIKVFNAFLLSISKKQIRGCFKIIDELVIRGHNLRNFLLELVDYIRTLLILEIIGYDEKLIDLTENECIKSQQIASHLGATNLLQLVDFLLEIEHKAKQSSNFRLLLETIVLRMNQDI